MNEELPKVKPEGLEEKSIKDNVLKGVESGNIRMKPRWHFVLRTALIASGTLLILFTALYISSFIFFNLRQTGILFIPYFGFKGLPIILKSMPWILVCLSIVFMMLLGILAEHYAFVYDKPLIYSILAIITLVVVGGIALGMTSLHNWHRDPLSYTQPSDVTIGRLINEDHDIYTIKDQRGLLIKISVTEDTTFPDNGVHIGEEVLVIGDRDDGQIHAEGIKRLSGYLPPPPMLMMP
jgi:hypothetical protein